MDTSLSVDDILFALRDCGRWNKRQDIMIPNLSWGLLNHEADLAIITKSGYLTEIEIKRSWSDFKADFNKGHQHKDERVYRFYYCVPESIETKVTDYLRSLVATISNPDGIFKNMPAVLVYGENGTIRGAKDSGWPEVGGRRLFIEEQLTCARLGCLRLWALKERNLLNIK